MNARNIGIASFEDAMLDDINAVASGEMSNEYYMRFLVNAYYSVQEQRKRTGNQMRDAFKQGHPTNSLKLLNDTFRQVEDNIRLALDLYSDRHPAGCWARSHLGVGPVLAAGLLAYIDFEKAVTAGHAWRYAGLDPTLEWKKGQKRNWSSRLKFICYNLGCSFVYVSNRPDAYYGEVYKVRKLYEQEKNEQKEYAEQAEKVLATRNIGKTTTAYKFYSQGMLPPAHIDARARRYTVKMFLAHFVEVGRRLQGLPVPKPYAVEHLGHVHVIEPPNLEVVGLKSSAA